MSLSKFRKVWQQRQANLLAELWCVRWPRRYPNVKRPDGFNAERWQGRIDAIAQILVETEKKKNHE